METTDPIATDPALALLLSEVRALRLEVSRLRRDVRRPEQTIYRPAELAARLGVKSRQHIYNLWNAGKLRYAEDDRGRYSTEAHVLDYLRDEARKRR